jgi:hypothetical protein
VAGRPCGARGFRKREQGDDDARFDAVQGEWSRTKLIAMNRRFEKALQREVREVPASRPLKRLNGQQLRTVLETAGRLRQATREPFYRAVEASLAACAENNLTDDDLHRAIKRALAELHVERKVTL